jgi:hypothetical protein
MFKKYAHFIPIIIIVPAFIYIMYINIVMATKQISIKKDVASHHFYFTSVEITPEITALANKLGNVQSILNYVTNIPYKVHTFNARKPLDTIKRNYGDCDDKSNLLSSLLSSLGFENYIVLVPSHAFVIVNLNQTLSDKKALHLNAKKYYILESTAKNSDIGYEFKYKINEIEAIINPLKKEIIDTSSGIQYF